MSSADNNSFANSLDPDQARQNAGPHLDPNCLTLTEGIPDFFFKSVNIKKKSADDNKITKNYPVCKELRLNH